jgi:predicted nucleic acid-binding protein
MSYLLDTNIVSFAIRKNRQILQKLTILTFKKKLYLLAVLPILN